MTTAAIEHDPVNAPAHYYGTNGMEVIDIIEAFGLHTSFHLGNAMKYILRAGAKGNAKQDLEKASWYAARWWVGGEDVGEWPYADAHADESFPVEQVVKEFKLTGARAEAAADLLLICVSEDAGEELWWQFVESLQRAIKEAE